MNNLGKISAIALFVILFSCSGSKKSDQKLIRPVRYQEAVNLARNQSRTFSGVSKAEIESNLSFKVSGTIESVNVKMGQKIVKATLIASIDQSDYELQYEQSRAGEKSAKAQRDLAKSSYRRVETLYENGNVSLSEYEQAKTTYESAKEQVEQLDKQTDRLRKQISYTKLYAPLDGVVGQVFAEPNENVASGQKIIELNSGQDLEVVVGIPESFIASLAVDDEVKIEFPALRDRTFHGRIVEVSYVSGQQSSTYPVTVKVKETDPFLRPGMTADVSFHFHTEGAEKAIFVPLVAVAREEEGTYVFTLEKVSGDTAIVHKKRISVGKIIDDGFEVTEGLEEGQLIVTAGISKLTDGLMVRMLSQ